MKFLLSISPWVWLLASGIFFACGEYLSKKFALSPSIWTAALIGTIYAIGSLLWLPAILKTNTLAITGTIWLLIGLAATVSIGLFVFGEQLSPYQWLGLLFAAAAVLLLGM